MSINRILGIIKYIAIYLGIVAIYDFLAMQFLLGIGYEPYLKLGYIFKIVAILITIAIYRIEREEIVFRTKSKKKKFGKILLILFTLGIAHYAYKNGKGCLHMKLQGGSVHCKCGGTGILSFDEEGIAEICVECMGSGMEVIDIELGDHPNWIRGTEQ